MGWIAALVTAAGTAYSAYEGRQNAKDASSAAYPWNVNLPGLGAVDFSGGKINIAGAPGQNDQWWDLQNASTDAMRSYNAGAAALPGAFKNLQNMEGQYGNQQQMDLSRLSSAASNMPSAFFGNGNTFQQQALAAQGLGNSALGAASQGMTQGQGYMNAGANIAGQALTDSGGLGGQQAGEAYTNMLRQQALPGEQQATASALTGLFNRGRLGTTGGANQMGALQQAQQQADIQRQIAGQQYGQQAYLNQLGAAQSLSNTGAGLFGQSLNNAGLGMGLGQSADAFGFDRQMGLSNTNFDRANQLYTASNTATQDRFNRALQMFGLQNANTQQQLANYQGMLGSQQGLMQGQLDLARLGASVGSGQAGAGIAAAQMNNQSTQDLVAGLLGAYSQYQSGKNNNGGGGS